MTNLGAKGMKDGAIQRSVQETGGGGHVAAGERRAWCVVERIWRFGADIGEMVGRGAAARLEAVITTAALNEADKGAWCREHGVFLAELEQWRASATAALA